MANNIALVGYTNRTTGLGNINFELYKNLPIKSICSIYTPHGQETWSENQMSIRHTEIEKFDEFLKKYEPDLLLFTESFMIDPSILKKYKIKKVMIMMFESKASHVPIADYYVFPFPFCPFKSRLPIVNMLLPIDTTLFEFRVRKERKFIMIYGTGGLGNRRQIDTVVDLLEMMGLEYIVKSKFQKRFPSDPNELYRDGDILIAVDAYMGYGRHIIEAMACGLPVITQDYFPANFWSDLTIKPKKSYEFHEKWVRTTYHELDRGALETMIKLLMEINISKLSLEARKKARRYSWENNLKHWEDFLNAI